MKIGVDDVRKASILATMKLFGQNISIKEDAKPDPTPQSSEIDQSPTLDQLKDQVRTLQEQLATILSANALLKRDVAALETQYKQIQKNKKKYKESNHSDSEEMEGISLDQDYNSDEDFRSEGFDINNWRDQHWLNQYKKVRAFQEAYGSFPRVNDDSTLYAWLNHQRYLHQQGKLSQNRVNFLSAIGFSISKKRSSPSSRVSDPLSLMALASETVTDSSTSSRRTKKRRRSLHYSTDTELASFHRPFSDDYEVGDDDKGEEFAMVSDEELEADTTPKDSKKRVKRSTRPGNASQWMKSFETIKKWKEEHQKFPTHRPLNQWQSDQRRHFREGKLSSEQIQALRSIDFDFSRQYRRGLPLTKSSEAVTMTTLSPQDVAKTNKEPEVEE